MPDENLATNMSAIRERNKHTKIYEENTAFKMTSRERTQVPVDQQQNFFSSSRNKVQFPVSLANGQF